SHGFSLTLFRNFPSKSHRDLEGAGGRGGGRSGLATRLEGEAQTIHPLGWGDFEEKAPSQSNHNYCKEEHIHLQIPVLLDCLCIPSYSRLSIRSTHPRKKKAS